MILDVAKRAAGILLLILLGLLLLKIAIGAVVGLLKGVVAIVLVGLFAFAAVKLSRR